MCYIVFLIHVLLEYSISCFTISNITNRSFDKLTMMTLTVVMHNNGHLSRKQMYTHHYRDIFFYTILKFFLQCFVLSDVFRMVFDVLSRIFRDKILVAIAKLLHESFEWNTPKTKPKMMYAFLL